MKENGVTMKIGMVQINNSFSNQNYLPYSVGLLQAYAQKHLKNKDHYEFLLPIYSRIQVEEAVEKLREADIVFFSTYAWNIRLSLEIAKRIKAQKPEIIVVVGGPQIPDQCETFLRRYSFIDLACHEEGEKIFSRILERCQESNWADVPSVSFMDQEGNFIQNPGTSRIKDLDDIPSPYLEGVFDSLINAYPNEKWIVLWETNRGCPFSCTYCDWGSASKSQIYKFGLERLFKEIDWMRNHQIEFVCCCDANFGILKRDVEIVAYFAENKRKYGYPQALSVQNTKNVTKHAYMAQKVLAEAGLNKGVSLSLQSLNDTTLKYIKRANISKDSFEELQHRFTKDNIETYTDMIIGLPGETYDSFTDGVSTVIENGQHNRIQFANLTILPNAEMGNVIYQKKYGMEIVKTSIINMHGSLSNTEEVQEMQQLVIATNSMSREDWVKTRAFSWMTSFLHFDKIIQIPFILLHKLGRMTYRELVEGFSSDKVQQFPILSEIRSFFVENARYIQDGGPEYCCSEKWLNIWWYPDELVLIKLCTENKLDDFYNEAKQLLKLILKEKNVKVPDLLLNESIILNRHLLKLPFQTEDLELRLSYNIWEFYSHVRKGTEIPIKEKPCCYLIDRTTTKWSSWEQWCQDVIWYGNKRGAYMYSLKETVVPSSVSSPTNK